ncbi:MAG: DUF454 family protein [Ignavibacteriales bacterium]|nr:MAG: DUF454 family protein [Ignavibacteriales bacterium]RPI70310.1 MAG: DUF454 family protein [Ignavibacteriales bacterium]
MKLEPVKSKTAKLIFLSFGFIFLFIGIIGLLLPLLPGWLFLIPSALCFAKASAILNRWLRKRKSLRKYFTDNEKVINKDSY